VASDLRDPNHKTFSEDQIGALINEGLSELDRLRPWERLAFLVWLPGQMVMTVELQTIIVLEAQNGTDQDWYEVPEATRTMGGIATDGWDQWGNQLYLPKGMIMTNEMGFRCLAYWDRDRLVNNTDVAQLFNGTDEEVVRCYARWTGMESLLHDRALFQQWQNQANNSDVSTTQLLQSASTFKSEWRDLRNRARRLRRVA
jgi:hypothetical protein